MQTGHAGVGGFISWPGAALLQRSNSNSWSKSYKQVTCAAFDINKCPLPNMEHKANTAELATNAIGDLSPEHDYILVENITRMTISANPRQSSTGRERNSTKLPLDFVHESVSTNQVDHTVQPRREDATNPVATQCHQTLVSAERIILQKQENTFTPVYHQEYTIETSQGDEEQPMAAVHRVLHQHALRQEVSRQPTPNRIDIRQHRAAGNPPRLGNSNLAPIEEVQVHDNKELLVSEMLQGVGTWI